MIAELNSGRRSPIRSVSYSPGTLTIRFCDAFSDAHSSEGQIVDLEGLVARRQEPLDAGKGQML